MLLDLVSSPACRCCAEIAILIGRQLCQFVALQRNGAMSTTKHHSHLTICHASSVCFKKCFVLFGPRFTFWATQPLS